MSRRTIGGGRVLGSGKGISSAASASQSKSPLNVPNHVVSPAASSLSLDSPAPTAGSSTPPSNESQDATSRLSIEHGPRDLSVAATAAGDRLVCPICNEEMMTLLQLNRHLDDAHKEIEQEEQEEVADWFKQQMIKAKKFQPLAVLNQKLKGLDVFESNNDIARTSTPTPRADHASSTGRDGTVSAPPAPMPPKKETIDPDEVVRKDHWQRRSGYDVCSDPTCGKRLGSTSNGIVNCRCCGKLFCDEHTMYQMKLSRSAQHEPVRGFWLRVCETCYKSRPGYNDRHGLERDHTSAFTRMRQERIDKQTMEVSRLEKRLTRLTQLMANPPEEVQVASKRWSLSWGQNDPRKALEQSVVSWQNDAEVARCPYCQQEFSQYTFRRHHCRTCGKVVCGDPVTGCSTILPLDVATTNSVLVPTEKPNGPATIPVDVRLCKECHNTLFAGRDFQASLADPAITAFTRSYSNLLQFERGIRLLLPKFQKLLQALQDPESPPTSTQIAEASRTRKRLMDAFTQYDVAARRIRDMPSPKPTQLKLQKAIYQNASQFLHLHMLPLKTLPKILKHATPHGSTSKTPNGVAPTTASTPSNQHKPPGALASIQFNHMRQDSSSALSMSSVTSSRNLELEAEEKSLRERLIVLEEQKFMVQEMVADANKRRKFDEVAALAGNVEDLSRECDEVQKLLEGVSGGIRGIYTGENG
ncbi:Vacuolar segregation protein PEP7 [Cyphellophora attinorum]|uniref:Vacuolar segregation protein PEP7 n=1 Tax=Cyphellophora attinorum TaxID=1664694 RepID=A0A0N0NMM7_9EURO|nr:Vacuolar segregation protein PEP7 [Phialophora attinorum]KPI40641.1 Vacuolar segregation protein PEP7 [Phialophora attinorum]